MKKVILILLLSMNILYANYIRDSEKEIIIDTKTNLIWQDDSNAKIIKKTWNESINYCESLTLGIYDDWRLPNFNELYSLTDIKKNNPAISSTFNNINTYYWSSTTYAISIDLAWVINFTNASDSASAKVDLNFVRCVR